MAAETSHRELGFERDMPGVSPEGAAVEVMSARTEELEEARRHLQNAKTVVRFLTDEAAVKGRSPQEVDAEVGAMVGNAVAGMEVGAVSPTDVTEVAVVGTVELAQPGKQPHTAEAMNSLSGDVLGDALGIAAAGGVDVREVTQEIDISVPNARASEDLKIIEETPSAEVFVSEVLNKNPEVHDTYNRPRPTYEIAGRKIVFRNRMEIVDIPGNTVMTVAADTVPPLDLSKSSLDHRADLLDGLNEFNSQHQQDTERAVLSVPNTPLGIAEAAVRLGSQEAIPLRDKLLQGKYADAMCQDFIDGILGATILDDNNLALDAYETDSYAISLASLVGDSSARKIMDARRDGLRALEVQRKQRGRQEGQRWLSILRHSGAYERCPAGPFPLEKMFAVHSTSHELEFDEQGNAVFRPAGQHSDTALVPRASWHMTINSGVFPHAQAGDAWGAQNRLVIASLQEMIGATGNAKLEALNGVDSWFSVSPGESVVVPAPIIIEATTGGDDLVQKDGNVVRFRLKQRYDEDEQRAIKDLARQYGVGNVDNLKGRQDVGADTLKEACLQMVLAECGLEPNDRDGPSMDGHGMTSDNLATRINMTCGEMGLKGSHFGSPESYLERQGYSQVLENVEQKLNEYDRYVASDAPLSAWRQSLVNGCLPAAPQMYPRAPKSHDFI